MNLHAKIQCGDGHVINNNEIKDIQIIREMNPISINLISSTCDFVYQQKINSDYTLSMNEMIDIYYDDVLHGRFYINNIRRTGEYTWHIQSLDIIGMLDNYTYMGGLYNNEGFLKMDYCNWDMTAYEIISQIISKFIENIGFIQLTIEPELQELKPAGHIPICTCREALSQVCFAIGAVASAFYDDGLKIYKLSDKVDQYVPTNRILGDIKVENIDKVAKLEVAYYEYSYTADPEYDDILLESKEVKDPKYIKMPSPMAHYWYEGDGKGNITEYSANYVLLEHLDEYKSLYGHKAWVKENIKTKQSEAGTGRTLDISGKTMITKNNIDSTLDRCFEYYNKYSNKITAKMYEGGHKAKYGQKKYGQGKYGEYILEPTIWLGNMISTNLGYIGSKTGRVISERYNLNGHIILKECVILV